MRIGVAADHAGQRLKDMLVAHLRSRGHDVRTYGPLPEPEDDYQLIARVLGEAVQRGEVERAVFCCGSGIGPAVALNKMSGIRAAVVDNEWSARDAVRHVDVNVLTLGERVIGEELAKSLVDEARVLKALKILGALIGGRALSADDVTSLARLPGRPQLQATFVGTLQAPLAGVVGVLTAAQGNLVRVLQARGSQ